MDKGFASPAMAGGLLMEPRTRIRSVSKSQARRLRLYAVIRKTYLLQHPLCEACHKVQPFAGYSPQEKWSEEIHHTRGKLGELLFATQFFKAVCRTCHNWIGDHPAQARELGLLCEKGQFN
jgi:hypothetical protein